MSQDQQNTAFKSVHKRDDEIDLMDIVDILVQRKRLIVIVTFLFVAVAILYCLVAARVYKTSITFGPPNIHTVMPLREKTTADDSMDDNVSVYKIYRFFTESLQSPAVRKDVWQELEDQEGVGLSFEAFDRSLSYAKQDPKRNRLMDSLDFEGRDPEYAKRAIGLLIIKANMKAVALFVDPEIELLTYNKMMISDTVERQKLNIKAKIFSLRQTAETSRQNRIEQLEGYLRIAQKAGVVTPGTQRKGAVGSAYDQSVLVTDNLPRYMLGEQAIREELAEIRQRKSNDPYIGDLVQLQTELDLLENFHADGGKVDESKQLANPFYLKEMRINEELARLEGLRSDSAALRAVSVDFKAYDGPEPVRPQKKKIVVLAFVLGLLFSIVVVFCMNFFEAYTLQKR